MDRHGAGAVAVAVPVGSRSRPAPRRRGGPDRRRNRRRPVRRACVRHSAPRREALERADRNRRPGGSDRLRHRDPRQRLRTHRHWSTRNPVIHVAGALDRRSGDARGRPVRSRRDPLFRCGGEAAVLPGDLRRDGGGDPVPAPLADLPGGPAGRRPRRPAGQGSAYPADVPPDPRTPDRHRDGPATDQRAAISS